jgi:peptidoglycan/LPS O-acetylase OafA/YrhL
MTTEGIVRPRKYRGLQILRITAACMVLLTHSTFYAWERLDRHFAVWAKGAAGVEIFFVLSGFVMIYSSEKLTNDPAGWKIFAARRIVRIVPIYWIATSAKILALLLTTGYVLHTRFSFLQALASYLFLPARGMEGDIAPVVGVGWTLNFEMFFYLLFTLALFLRVNVYKFVGPILALLAMGAFLRKPDWPAIAFYLDTRVLLFFYGMVIAGICMSGKHLPKYPAIALLCVGFLGLAGPWNSPAWLHGLPDGIAAFFIIYSTASLEDSLTRIPRFILFAADASYAIYLFHPFIAPAVPLALMKFHLIHPWLSVVSSVVLALAGGCLIHLFVEAPIAEWARRFLPASGNKSVQPMVS